MPLTDDRRDMAKKLAEAGALTREVGGIAAVPIKRRVPGENSGDPPLAIVYIEGITSINGTVAAAIGREAIHILIEELEKSLAIN